MDYLMSRHAYGNQVAGQSYAEAIAAGSGWVYESVRHECKRCHRGFVEVVTVYGHDNPIVCPDCEMQLRADAIPDSITT